MKGVVKFYIPDKGYGFIIREETGTDVFVYHTNIKFVKHVPWEHYYFYLNK